MSSRTRSFVGLCFAATLCAACTLPPLASPTRSAATVANSVAAPTPPVSTRTPAVPVAGTPSLAPPRGGAATPAPDICQDHRAPELITRLTAALEARDGSLLASLVHPVHGLDVQLLRGGTVVNYDQQHADYLFQSDYVVDWGPAPGSGLETKGSFRDLVLPALLDLLAKPYELSCNQLRVGGVTYTPLWPYPSIGFYSAYFPGTAAFGQLDWHTWAIGLEYAGDEPYLRAMTQYRWEP